MTELEKDKRIAWLETEIKGLKQDYENCAKAHQYDAQSLANKIAVLLCRTSDADVTHLLMKFQAADFSRRNCLEFAKYLDAILKGKSIDE